MAADEPEHRTPDDPADDGGTAGDFGVRLTWPGADTDADEADEFASTSDAAPAFGGLNESAPTDDDDFLGSPWTSAASLGTGRGEGAETYSGVPVDDDGHQVGGPMGSSLAARIESLHTSLNALGMRVEALVSGTSGMRTALGDRLNDHADTLGRLVRSQTSDLEEFQRGTDRTLTELRRTSADADEAVQRVAARLDELAGDIDGLARVVQASVDEGRDLATASDKLSRQVVEGLDTFGDRLLERLDELDTSLAAEVGTSRAEVARIAQLLGGGHTVSGGGVEEALERLRDELADLNDSAEELPNLRAEMARVRADLTSLLSDGGAGAGSEIAEELAALRASLLDVRRQQDDLSEAAKGLLALQDAIELVPADGEEGGYEGSSYDVGAELAALRETFEVGGTGVHPGELADLRAELASLRADLIELTANEEGPSEMLTAEIGALRSELAGLRKDTAAAAKAGKGSAASNGASEAGLEAIRSELQALRRRLNLKAKPSAVTLDDEQLGRLADEVGARLRSILQLDPDDRG